MRTTASTQVRMHRYADAAAMTAAVAERLRAACLRGLSHRGHALLCLAGGRTPLPIYRTLAECPIVEWEDVALIPGDDRCVAHDHAASNVAALRSAFANAAGVRIESLTAPDGDPADSLAHARAMLRRHHAPFDAVVLGMGEDAHTASLFPGAEALPAALESTSRHDAFLIHPDPLPPEAPFPRITLGLARLLRAREHHLIVTGDRKLDVLHDALDGYDPLSRPVSALLHAPGIAMHVHWSP